MKYLLDTHIWLWSLLEPYRLDKNIVKVLENKDNELFISPITVWETLILAEKGRIELLPSPNEWINVALKRSPVKEARLSHAIAIREADILNFRIMTLLTVSLLRQHGKMTLY